MIDEFDARTEAKIEAKQLDAILDDVVGDIMDNLDDRSLLNCVGGDEDILNDIRDSIRQLIAEAVPDIKATR